MRAFAFSQDKLRQTAQRENFETAAATKTSTSCTEATVVEFAVT